MLLVVIISKYWKTNYQKNKNLIQLAIHEYMEIHTTNKIIVWSVIVAIGGFLFGFDTAVISGVEKHIQELFQLSSFNMVLRFLQH